MRVAERVYKQNERQNESQPVSVGVRDTRMGHDSVELVIPATAEVQRERVTVVNKQLNQKYSEAICHADPTISGAERASWVLLFAGHVQGELLH